MKTKTIVSFSLLIFILLLGSIIISGFVDFPLFSFVYFLFVFLVLLGVVLYSKENLKGRKIMGMTIVIGFIFIISLIFFWSSLKVYSQEVNQINNYTEIANREMQGISEKNIYYQKYIDYLMNQINLPVTPGGIVNNQTIIEINGEDNNTQSINGEEDSQEENDD